MARGARKFSFLGRSGTDKPTARAIVEELESAGATVNVVRGDVTSSSDIERLVDQLEGNLGGVIHAAMGLSVSVVVLRRSSQVDLATGSFVHKDDQQGMAHSNRSKTPRMLESTQRHQGQRGPARVLLHDKLSIRKHRPSCPSQLLRRKSFSRPVRQVSQRLGTSCDRRWLWHDFRGRLPP